MKTYLISKACKQSLSFLWHPHRLTTKLKMRIAKYKKKQLNLQKIKEQTNRETDLKIRLEHKREVKALFGGLPEKHRKTNLFHAKKQKGNLRHAFLLGLEMRLDTCVFRMNLFPTFGAARQAIRHGHLLVNGREAQQATRVLRPGDFIQVKTPFLDSWKTFYMKTLKTQTLIKKNSIHIEVNPKLACGIILCQPQQIYYPFQVNLPAGNL
jgi:ribosomal protein S4